jgi:hypothetical protein
VRIAVTQPDRQKRVPAALAAFPHGRYRHAPHVAQAEQAGTIVLFDQRTYYTLPNAAATDLWRLLAEPRSAEELVAWLSDAYEAPRDVIAADVAAQLARLRNDRLIVDVRPDGVMVSGQRPWWHFWRRGV